MGNNSNSNKSFAAFVEELKKEEKFNSIGPGLALIKPGDWNAIVQWGEDCGYQFTLTEIQDFVNENPHIFNDIPTDHKLSNWNSATLAELMVPA